MHLMCIGSYVSVPTKTWSWCTLNSWEHWPYASWSDYKLSFSCHLNRLIIAIMHTGYVERKLIWKVTGCCFLQITRVLFAHLNKDFVRLTQLLRQVSHFDICWFISPHEESCGTHVRIIGSPFHPQRGCEWGSHMRESVESLVGCSSVAIKTLL